LGRSAAHARLHDRAPWQELRGPEPRLQEARRRAGGADAGRRGPHRPPSRLRAQRAARAHRRLRLQGPRRQARERHLPERRRRGGRGARALRADRGVAGDRAVKRWAALAALAACSSPRAAPTAAPVVVPRLWDDAALAGWATPVAGLGVPPTYP